MGWVGWGKKGHPEVFCVAPEAHQLSNTSKLVEQKSCNGICSDAWLGSRESAHNLKQLAHMTKLHPQGTNKNTHF